MWGADWKAWLAEWCQTITWVTEFSICIPKNHYGFFFLHTLPSTIAFRFEYVLFYQFYAKITTFLDQEKFDMAPLLYNDVETFGRNWLENDVKTSKMTSKSSYWCHARESSYTPHVRHFLAPVRFTEILIGYPRILCILLPFMEWLVYCCHTWFSMGDLGMQVSVHSSVRSSICQQLLCVSWGRNSCYSFVPIVLKLCRCFHHGIRMCMWFGYIC